MQLTWQLVYYQKGQRVRGLFLMINEINYTAITATASKLTLRSGPQTLSISQVVSIGRAQCNKLILCKLKKIHVMHYTEHKMLNEQSGLKSQALILLCWGYHVILTGWMAFSIRYLVCWNYLGFAVIRFISAPDVCIKHCALNCSINIWFSK